MRIPIKSIIIFLLFIVFNSCDKHVAFESNHKINSETWHRDSIISFQTSINDTTQVYDVYINLRNSTDYNYRNLFLFFETIMPDGKIVKDTLECILADRTGKWYGKGFGRVKSNRFLFRENVWFPRTGSYQFRIEQAMREENLSGVIDIGIRIEKK